MTIDKNVDLKSYNTFGISVTAKYFTILSSAEEAKALFASEIFNKEHHLFLGGGSNLLFTNNYDGLIVKVEIKGKEVVAETDETVTLKVGAGENWHGLVMYCVEQNWGGIENLALIPGTVGAAPIQNIGAYGVEIRQIISGVQTVEISSGATRIFTNSDCNFGYRESIFKQELKDKYLISSITLTLTKKNHQFNTRYGAINEVLEQHRVDTPTLKSISDAVIHIRSTKLPDPSRIGNAGSFFKNPSIQVDLHDFIKAEFPSVPSFPSAEGLVKIPAAWPVNLHSHQVNTM